MRYAIWILTSLLIAATAAAQTPMVDLAGTVPDTAVDPVSLEAFRSLSSAPAGGRIQLAVILHLAPHWHVNADETRDEFLIPTQLKLNLPEGMQLAGVVFPEPVEKTLGFSENPLLLFEEEAVIGAAVDVSPDIVPGDYVVRASVTYQACDSKSCLAPVQTDLEIPVPVSKATDAIDAIHPEVFAKVDFSDVALGPSRDAERTESETRLGSVIAERGYFVAFLVVFVWGLALNLTPCVYPIIPITVGYFGGQSQGRTSRTLLLASLYVLGMAVMYSLLGLFAAVTGSLLGTALQNPFVILFVALVLAAMAFSMFGFFEIRIPMQLTGLAGKSTAKGGAIGAFLTGLTVGIVAAPCIGPFVLALLTYVGETGNPLLGFTLFFTLALGLGVPFIFLAMASGSISRLPRSGEWMEWVKKLFGLILLVMAVYFLEPLLVTWIYYLALSLLLVAGGLWLGFALRVQSTSPVFRMFKRLVGVAVPLLGIYLFAAPGHVLGGATTKAGVHWSAYTPEARSAAVGRPVIIDFAAEWCIPCKELDIRTFTDPGVIAAAGDVVTLKADLTRTGSPEVTALREQYGIRGVPTIVFLDADGKERDDLRVLGFVNADDFLRRVKSLKGES